MRLKGHVQRIESRESRTDSSPLAVGWAPDWKGRNCGNDNSNASGVVNKVTDRNWTFFLDGK